MSLLNIPCQIDVSYISNKTLLDLHHTILQELNKRNFNPSVLSKPNHYQNHKNINLTDAYLHKWSSWTQELGQRSVNWKWRRNKGSWQMEMIIQDERGEKATYKRWGKTKWKTQYALAKYAWYRYLNLMDAEPNLSMDDPFLPAEDDLKEVDNEHSSPSSNSRPNSSQNSSQNVNSIQNSNQDQNDSESDSESNISF